MADPAASGAPAAASSPGLGAGGQWCCPRAAGGPDRHRWGGVPEPPAAVGPLVPHPSGRGAVRPVDPAQFPRRTGGAAADNYNALLATATRNGISADKLPLVLGMNSIDDVLKELQLGESITNFEQKIRNYAKTAMPDWVRGRIDQGENLQDIVSPYISTVADTLEMPWTSVDVTNPYIQSALAQNKTLYDLARDLRKDPNWQYTNKARQETSNAVLGVLRDFGFQG